jgi:hypothetical protein
MSGTKNLGQVAGLYIGTSAPSNTTLIWYDSTPAIKCHKVYNESLGQWIILDNTVISAITYSVLSNLAQTVGLTIGQWFKITDKSNALALAITSTKIQYTDTLGNIIIDDLGHNQSYIVSSSNLLIDDVLGVYDTDSNKLLFTFEESVPENNDNFYILGKASIGSIWKLVKYKMTSLLSTVTGNSISWNNGFYLNFFTKLSSYYDTSGGIVSKDTYDKQVATTNQQITNVANNIQNVVSQATASIESTTTDEKIYEKKLPVQPTYTTPIDIVQNDTLQNIVIKVHRWIQKFKYATGIMLSSNYTEAKQYSVVSNNDSVETAIGKLAYAVRNFNKYNSGGTDSIEVSQGYEVDGKHEEIYVGQSNLTALLNELTFRINRNIQPIFSIIAFYQEPTYDNVMRYAGYGWFPCGKYFYNSTRSTVVSEKNKWVVKYPELTADIEDVEQEYCINFKGININGEIREIPNLCDKFLRSVANDTQSQRVGTTGGSDTHTISANELPDHVHTATCSLDGNHDHGMNSAGEHSHTFSMHVYDLKGELGSVNENSGSSTKAFSTHASGAHVHTISKSGNHFHTITVNGGSTGNKSFSVVPTYTAVAYLIRLL